jgi:uncharacterized small protein (DUF1192 family)
MNLCGKRVSANIGADTSKWRARTETMPIDPDDLPIRKKATEILLSADLYAMSEPDLAERIALLEGEIVRCREAIQKRQATKNAADSFFKK